MASYLMGMLRRTDFGQPMARSLAEQSLERFRLWILYMSIIHDKLIYQRYNLPTVKSIHLTKKCIDYFFLVITHNFFFFFVVISIRPF